MEKAGSFSRNPEDLLQDYFSMQIATSEKGHRQSTPNILKLGFLESLEISVFSM